MSMAAFSALVKKDLLLFFKDRRSVVMSFAAPIVIASFFGFVLGERDEKDRPKLPLQAVDQDNTPVSARIIEQLKDDASLAVTVNPSVEAAREAVQKGNAVAAVIFPKGFAEQAGRALFGAAAKPELPMLFDPSRAAEREMVKGILTGQVMQVISGDLFGGGAGTRGMIDRSLAELRGSSAIPRQEREALERLLGSVNRWNDLRGAASGGATAAEGAGSGGAGGLQVPFQVAQQAVTARRNTVYNSFAHSFTGMGVQFILFMGIEAGVSLLLLRQRGLWRRFRAAPISKHMLLGSRAVSAALTALLIIVVLFAFARVVFGVRIEGSLAGFILVAVTFACMTAAFGLLVAAYGNTPEATRPLAVLATLVMVMLGGSWVPTFVFPAWMQQATKIMPTRWAVDGLNGMTWRGLGFDFALTCSAVLLGFTVLFAVLALRRFRWDSD